MRSALVLAAVLLASCAQTPTGPPVFLVLAKGSSLNGLSGVMIADPRIPPAISDAGSLGFALVTSHPPDVPLATFFADTVESIDRFVYLRPRRVNEMYLDWTGRPVPEGSVSVDGAGSPLFARVDRGDGEELILYRVSVIEDAGHDDVAGKPLPLVVEHVRNKDGTYTLGVGCPEHDYTLMQLIVPGDYGSAWRNSVAQTVMAQLDGWALRCPRGPHRLLAH